MLVPELDKKYSVKIDYQNVMLLNPFPVSNPFLKDEMSLEIRDPHRTEQKVI